LENKKREENETNSFVLKEKYEKLEVLAVENHRLYFDIA
jgi:hypothetical protein